MILLRILIFCLMLCCGLFAQVAFANVVGNGTQNFNTIPSGLDFLTVHSSETLDPGIINLGIFANQAVNTLPYYDGGVQGRTRFNDTLLGLDLNVGYGLFENFEVGLSLPFVLQQTVSSSNNSHGEFARAGNTEVRGLVKYRFYGDDHGGLAVIGSVNVNRTENNPFLGQGSGSIYNLEFAWDTTIGKWATGANIGYRKVNSGPQIVGYPIEPMRDQWIASLAGSYRLASLDTKLILELFASQPTVPNSSNSDRSSSSLEGLAGLKYDINHQLSTHVGGGTEILNGASSPDWRIYVGLNYTLAAKKTFAALKPVTDGRDTKIVTSNILFEFDSDQVQKESLPMLEEIANLIKVKGPFRKILITGHTDSIGNAAYNLALSQRRANTLRQYFAEKHKIAPETLEAKGRGEEVPIADDGNFQGRQLNRRVEFTFEK